MWDKYSSLSEEISCPNFRMRDGISTFNSLTFTPPTYASTPMQVHLIVSAPSSPFTFPLLFLYIFSNVQVHTVHFAKLA